MKLNLIIVILLLCLQKTFSKNDLKSPDSLKVIIACLVNESEKIDNIKKMLQNDTSVTYVGYCSNHKVFLLQLSGDQQGAVFFAEKFRKQANLSDQTFYIKEYQFGDILSFCASDNYRRDKKSKK